MRIGVERITFSYRGQEAWVEVRKPTAGELLSFAKHATGDALESCYSLLDAIVQAWNFEDAKGKPIKVNPQNIRALPGDLLAAMVGKVQEACVGLPLASRKPSTGPSSSETVSRP
jgi:hypothetical protein